MSTNPRSTNPIMAMFASEPALVSSEKTDQFMACVTALAGRPDIDKMLAETASASDNFWPEPDSWKASYRPYVVVNGILQIPVRGVLLHNFPWQDGGWATGYDYILRAFQRGVEDFKAGNIKGIALICHTPGGMVAGCGDTANKMVALKTESGVPVRGFAHESAYSAGYWIISTADRIDVSSTGGVGSIGVVTSHTDWSEWNKKMGFAHTYIFEGKHKVDGNGDAPLPDDVKQRIQARLHELYEVFVSSVARNRGMDPQAVRDTEALTFTATQALSNGLADFIGPLDDALSAFADDLSSSEGDENMSTPKDTAAVDQAAIDTAVTAALAKASADQASAVVEARNAERARVSGITGCDEAKGREALASHIAMNTDMSVDDAKAMLAAAPAAAAAPVADTQTPFDAAASKDNPDLGAGNGSGGDAAAGDRSGEIMALVRNAGIVGFNPASK